MDALGQPHSSTRRLETWNMKGFLEGAYAEGRIHDISFQGMGVADHQRARVGGVKDIKEQDQLGLCTVSGEAECSTRIDVVRLEEEDRQSINSSSWRVKYVDGDTN